MPLAVYVLGLGIFSQVTSEFMVAGLMAELAGDLGVSVAQIGYLISVYAAAMTIGGPLMTLGLLKMPRRRALLLLFGVFLVGQVLGATAPGYEVMVVARLITGVAASAFYGVALALCAEVVGPELRGRAMSIVLGGMMVGTVLGLPAASLIGSNFGWRASFWAVAALAALAALITYLLIPASPRPEVFGVREELTAFRSGRLWAVYATSLLVIGATFAAFSYLTPILTDVSGFSAGTVPLLLVGYGAATVLGNFVVGRLADRFTLAVLAVGVLALAVFLTVFAIGAGSGVVAVASLIGIGLVGITMNPALATRVVRTANGRPLVNTVHTAVITLGIMIGSWAGGLGISQGGGLRSPLWIGLGLALAGFLTLVPDLLRRPAAATPENAPLPLSEPTELSTPAELSERH
ncbi:MFS transporter [Streptomyces sp. NPDC059009]|uniref:MFS transporter n=1 Tax=Streptomyces sp. NPDC059009 TaxID=3346694 RepID=UPI0036ABE65E